MDEPLLVVAGEASGDRMAAGVLDRLQVQAWGMGGPEVARHAGEPLIDARQFAVMGGADVVRKAPRLLGALGRLLTEARRRRPRRALLVGYSEFNARLGPRLRALGARVVWYGAPQIWAWRPARARSLGRACDSLAVILPFEPDVWRAHGVDAHYVGHPSVERQFSPRSAARRTLGLSDGDLAIALLPGSRPGEVKRLLEPMLAAARRISAVRSRVHIHVLPSLALPESVRIDLTRRARLAGAAVTDGAMTAALAAFDVAVAASGTVTLECALAGVPPLIVYRTDAASAFIARRLLTVDHVGLPNLVLGGRCFPELLQAEAEPERMAIALEGMLAERPRLLTDTERVRAALDPEMRPSHRVADLLA